MIKGLVGKKIGMSSVFLSNGGMVPVTILYIEPAQVIQIKTITSDKYSAAQMGFGQVTKSKLEKLPKAFKSHFKDLSVTRKLKEFEIVDSNLAVGQKIDASLFKTGDFVDVAGNSKGRGFAGVFKRYNFAGGIATHGHRFHRTTGSIGNRKFPGRVFKNKKMPGHMGNERVTIQNLKVVEVKLEQNYILLQGAVPGPNGSFVEVNHAVKKSNVKI